MKPMSTTETRYDIAVIGGGAAGVLATLQLLRQATGPSRIALIESAAELADGVAYATRRAEHVLNVPAGKMSAFPDQPGDFVDWLLANGHADDAAEVAPRYVPRMWFAAYLRDRLQQARAVSPATLSVIHDQVQALDKLDAGLRLTLADGGDTLQVDSAVLALGNALRPLPLPDTDDLGAGRCLQAWNSAALAEIDPDESLCVIGSGLSMADCLVYLDSRRHRGVLHVVSRHGLMPLPHSDAPVVPLAIEPLLAMSLRQRLRTLRQEVGKAAAAGIGWQGVMDGLRPHGQALWRSLDRADQRRFLRHVVRYWDIHRHRVATEIHARLQAWQDRGQLQVHRARLDRVVEQDGQLWLEGRGADGRLRLQVDRLLNATGVETRVERIRNPLLQQLLAAGHARPGPHGLGLDNDADGCLYDAAGQVDPRLRVVGSLRIGTLWESLAVPELRQQAVEQATFAAQG